jgi:hypothetical protein
MNLRAYIAAIVGGIFKFLASWAILGFLLVDFYLINTFQYEGLTKEPMPDLIFLGLSGLAFSFLMTIIFVKWAGVSTFKGGFRNGMILSFFYICAIDFGLYGFYNLMNLSLTAVDIVIQTVFGGVMGGIIGWVLGFKK